MKHSFYIFLLGLTLCLAALVGATSSATNGLKSDVDGHKSDVNGHKSDVDGHQSAVESTQPASAETDFASDGETFNITVALNGTSADTVKALGYDPSKDYHSWATVEVWTGGHSRAPVNFGDTRGSALSDKVFKLLDQACPADKSSPGRTCCKDSGWKTFTTNALIKGAPSWKVGLRQARVRTEAACWDNEGIRIVMAQIVADTLRAYVRKAKYHNCYDVPGENGGIYCNVPQLVRVNLPKASVASEAPHEPTTGNFWHVETWGTDALHQFSEFGELRPCRTRKEVDKVMDKYANDLVGLFPHYRDSFHREARVIIDGYKVCTNEP